MPARSYHLSCHFYSDNTIYHARPPGHTKYYAKPARPYHIPCHACQAIPYILHCPQAIAYTISCPVGHTIYHVMTARPYHVPCHVGSRSGRPSITSLKAEMLRIRNVSLPGAQVKEDTFSEIYYLLFIRGQ